jgi:hypothetical protein
MTNGDGGVDLRGIEVSIAMCGTDAEALGAHLDKGPHQEDLTFFYWKPSRGETRYTAIISTIAWPTNEERVLEGNVSFTSDYLRRVLAEVPDGCGVGLAHSHLGPGWQGMSDDDIVAERDRLAGAVFGRTGLPVAGITRGTDGSWGGRLWSRVGRGEFARADATTVRVAGRSLGMTYHPEQRPRRATPPAQQATVSVWGEIVQSNLARSRVGIVGLGSVGSIVNEALSRVGVQEVVLIDHDHIEERNLDRTLGATRSDVNEKTPKVGVAARTARQSSTAAYFLPRAVNASLLSPEGLAAALDCDVIICCVDRPWPRFVLNVIANAHMIPLIDGGILARVNDRGLPLHIDWRIHTTGPGRACLYCLGALLRSDVALDRAGKLDDPDYFRNLPVADQERYGRRNVFPFSLSVAAHEVLHLAGLLGGGQRVGGIGPQHYQAYPGVMTVAETTVCMPDCEMADIPPATSIEPLLMATE